MIGPLVDVVLVVAGTLYLAATLVLFVLGTNLIVLSVIAWRHGRATSATSSPVPARTGRGAVTVPAVTVQLPIYNELYVAERVIRAAAALDHPPDRLQIQVLDDSTDETSSLIADVVAELAADGVDIVHLRRTERVGYKAGALADGMRTATGEFIAIFDADFVPDPDFLRRTLHEFDDPSVAFVQGRWGHLNRDYSIITRLQSLAIDAHFLVEQAARRHRGFWFNFNGTAGVWRAEAIEDAGGWTADTLTEDLDLSYRAHLRGWRGRYREDVVVPGELPDHVAGFRRQQHRWARGSLEVAVKLLPAVWRSPTSVLTRFQATTHLTAYSIHLLLALLALLYPLVVILGQRVGGYDTLYGLGYLFAISSLAPGIFFITGQRQLGRPWPRDLGRILAVTVLGSGLMLNTVRAAVQIRTRPNPEFERTAKYGVRSDAAPVGDTVRAEAEGRRRWGGRRYLLGFDRIVFGEVVLGAYAAASAVLAARNQSWGILLYATVFAAGLWSLAAITVWQSVAIRRSRRRLTVSSSDDGNDRASDVVASLSVAKGAAGVTPGHLSTDLLEADDGAVGTGPVTGAILIMAKRPKPGASKTRLSPALDADEAAALSECMIADAVEIMTEAAAARPGVEVRIAGTPADAGGYFAGLAPTAGFVAQQGADLGHRLDHVLSATLAEGTGLVVAVNSDSPTLPPALVVDAIDTLAGQTVDVVLGPAEDGGYYLIGWKRPHPRLVTEVTMSTATVLADTLAIAAEEGLTVALTEPWWDVDDPADLDRVRAAIDRGERCGPRTAAFLAGRPSSVGGR
ncbi:MAG: TIGR04282 family arsenosugar biosynthesis glycosyltransferase [Actinomycetota bacterium]